MAKYWATITVTNTYALIVEADSISDACDITEATDYADWTLVSINEGMETIKELA